jgi:hypothetical protein
MQDQRPAGRSGILICRRERTVRVPTGSQLSLSATDSPARLDIGLPSGSGRDGVPTSAN